MVKGSIPYIIPMNFGYDGRSIFLHSAREGRKIAFLTSGNSVCFEMETEVSLLSNTTRACSWSAQFKSVIGYGSITELTAPEEMTHGLDQIMAHYSSEAWEYPQGALSTLRVWKLTIDSVTGKQS